MHIKIRICKFDKYMARKDLTKPWWFKMSNTILEDPEIYQLTDPEFKALVYCFCQASKKGSSEVLILKAHAEKASNVDWASLVSMANRLEQCQIIEIIESGQMATTIRPRSGQQIRLEEIRLEERRVPDQDQVQAELIEEMHWMGELWNLLSGDKLKKIKTTKSRMAVIKKRLKEKPSQEYWKGVIEKVSKSDFLTGSSAGGWTAPFDWVIGEDKKKVPNHEKISEGNYDNKEGGEKGDSAKAKATAFVDLMISSLNQSGNINDLVGQENYSFWHKYTKVSRFDIGNGSVKPQFKRGEWIDLFERIFKQQNNKQEE